MHSQGPAPKDVGVNTVAHVDTVSRIFPGLFTSLHEDSRIWFSETGIFGKHHYREMRQQSGALKFSNLLVPHSVGNDSEPVRQQRFEAGLCVGKCACSWFILGHESPITHITLGIAEFRHAEDFPHAFAPLSPGRKLTAAEALKMLPQDGVPDGGKLLASKWNLASELIVESQTGVSRGTGMVNECAVDVKKNHGTD